MQSSEVSSLKDSANDRGRAIIQAAVDCFTEKGVRSTTMDDIARRASLSRRTVYYYFPSKEALLHAAFERNACDFISKLSEQLDNSLPFPEFVTESVMFIIEHVPQEPLYQLNIAGELGMESGTRYFSSGATVEKWIEAFQPGYIRALREGSINPQISLVEIIEWVGRLSLSFIQHPRVMGTTLPEIRKSVELLFGNALKA